MNDFKDYPCLEKDVKCTTGVLLSDEIEFYATKHRMIVPFDPKSLKSSGYRLHLGAEYTIGGKRKKLTPDKDEMIIEPFEVAIISVQEIINLPRFIIARWNLRVDKIYDGLLWTGAQQVDAGWSGPLFCPIYNLSNKDVVLKLGEPIILMDFTKTTPYQKNKSKDYPHPPKRIKIDDYKFIQSALFTEAGIKLKETEKKVKGIENMIAVVFACIAVLVTTLAIFVTSGQKSKYTIPFWLYLSTGFSLVALISSFYARIRIRLSFRPDKDRWLKFGLVAYMIISSILIVFLVIKTWWLF